MILIRGMVKLFPLGDLEPMAGPTINNQKFLVPSTRTTLLKNSYFPDTIRLWNMLPQQVVDSPSIDVFKTLVCDVNFC